MARRLIIFTYGTLIYAAFLGVFLYAIGFVGDLLVPKGINSGPASSTGIAIAINVLLLGAFAIQHTIMARPAFKKWWTGIIPKEAERSTFVLATCICFTALFTFWQPLTDVVWSVQAEWARIVILAIFFAGWGFVLYSTFLINHFDLFGLRQVWLCLRGKSYTGLRFTTRSVYRYIRHPLMLGFLVAFWAAPDMTVGRLLFAAVTTVYILLAIRVEERDLVAYIGGDYEEYRKTTPGLIPWPGRSAPPAHVEATTVV